MLIGHRKVDKQKYISRKGIMAPAVSEAVYMAKGSRCKDLPIMHEKILGITKKLKRSNRA